MARATFSLDQATIAEIRRTAARLRKPQSHIIREAIADYAARADRLSERERAERLALLRQLRNARATRTARAVDDELAAIRSSRRRGGRRTT